MQNNLQIENQYLAELKDINFGYNEKLIFNSINLNTRKGQITVIMGPNRCGKTTLLHLITGFNKPDKRNSLAPKYRTRLRQGPQLFSNEEE